MSYALMVTPHMALGLASWIKTRHRFAVVVLGMASKTQVAISGPDEQPRKLRVLGGRAGWGGWRRVSVSWTGAFEILQCPFTADMPKKRSVSRGIHNKALRSWRP